MIHRGTAIFTTAQSLINQPVFMSKHALTHSGQQNYRGTLLALNEKDSTVTLANHPSPIHLDFTTHDVMLSQN